MQAAQNIHQFKSIEDFRKFKTKHKGLKKVQKKIEEIVGYIHRFYNRGYIHRFYDCGHERWGACVTLSFFSMKSGEECRASEDLRRSTEGKFGKVYINVTGHCVYVMMNGLSVASLSLMTESLDLNGNPGAISVHPIARIK